MRLSAHAKKQLEKRGISELEAQDTVERGEEIFCEINGRFGTKHYSKTDYDDSSLVAVWFWSRDGSKEIVTVYWRHKR